MRTKKNVIALLAALLVGALTVSVGGAPVGADRSGHSGGGEATYEITVTNNTSGQYLTPPNWAAHQRGAHVFQLGAAPSPGVVAVAERGEVPVLAAELTQAIDNAGIGISGVIDAEAGPIPPGESRTATFTTDQSRISLVSMIICTNDGFGGIDSDRLPGRDGETRYYNLADFDAGAELNTELRADVVPAPFCGDGEGNGGEQPEIDGFNRINRHPTLQGVGDLPASFDWPRGSVGNVSITRIAAPTNYGVTVTNITQGQYFTPPNFAAHNRSADVFTVGHPASPGVEAVAELGGVPVLAAELAANIDANGLGVSGVGGDAPLPPGASTSFDFTTTESRLSIVSMIICTNDGFAGLDARVLPRHEGQSRTYYLRAYDAGTELNTELRADVVPAPFCGEGGGNDADQPEIDGRGFIGPHPTLLGVGDLPAKFDWKGPVLAVTVTNNG